MVGKRETGRPRSETEKRRSADRRVEEDRRTLIRREEEVPKAPLSKEEIDALLKNSD